MSREKPMSNEEFMNMVGKLSDSDSPGPTYTTKPGQGKELVLFIDGNQSVCPFTAPIPFSGSMGQVQIMRLPCNTLCPFASVQGDKWVTKCTGEYDAHPLSKEPEIPIINMQ